MKRILVSMMGGRKEHLGKCFIIMVFTTHVSIVLFSAVQAAGSISVYLRIFKKFVAVFDMQLG